MRYTPTLFQYIIADLQDSLQYLPAGIAVGILTLMFAMLMNRFSDMKIKLLPAFFLAVYLTSLAYLVFFNREAGSRDGVALRLFETVGNGVRGDSYVVENILLFVPFGILLPWLCGRQNSGWVYVLVTGCLASVLIELIQLITKCGFCQLDDVVMNTIGVAVGYACYLFACFCGKCARCLLMRTKSYR